MKEDIGKRIKLIRQNLNMSKEEFAKLLGVTGQYVGILEKGKSYLSIDKLKKLCEISNLSSDYILFGKDTTLQSRTKETLSNYSDKQLIAACEALSKLALFIKYSE